MFKNVGELVELAQKTHKKIYELMIDYEIQESGEPYDERMRDALEIIQDARRPDGTWQIGLRFPGEEHFRMEAARKPSRYLTLRALRVLRAYVGGLEGVDHAGGTV